MKRILFFSLFLIVFQETKSQVANTTDSLALVSLYNSTGGTNWYNRYSSNAWLNGTVSSWGGVTLNSGGRVIGLDLSYNNLSGAIPSAFGNLAMLSSVILTGNSITGSIPVSISNLINLTSIDLSDNQLSGSIPTVIGNLVKLTKLDFSRNQLTGNIPTTIGGLVKLTSLSLAGNKLTGNIPSGIGNLTALTNLYLANKLLSGSIPSTIGNLKLLTNLNFYNNQLTGSIPASIGSMTSLEQINLYTNQLSGAIPSTLSNLKNLSVIEIFDNKFTFAGMELVENFVFSQANGGAGIRNYSQQANVPLKNVKNVLSVSVGGTPYNNSFYWYKDGNLVGTTYSDSTFTATTAGKYWVVVNNSVCTSLTLSSDTLYVFNLPVVLKNFSSGLINNQIELNWQTANEINVSHFVIQRSNDGIDYTTIGSVNAVGIGNNGYNFSDIFPMNGINYYRLQSVDKDGSITNSEVVHSQFSIKNYQLAVYPNPTRNFITVIGNHIAIIQVVDNMGRVVKVVSLTDAKNPIISVGDLPKGVYDLRVQTIIGKVCGVEFVKE